MSAFVGHNEVGAALSKILGIERVVDIDLAFHMKDIARAKVTFLLNNIQAEAIVELLRPTEWGQRNDI